MIAFNSWAALCLFVVVDHDDWIDEMIEFHDDSNENLDCHKLEYDEFNAYINTLQRTVYIQWVYSVHTVCTLHTKMQHTVCTTQCRSRATFYRLEGVVACKASFPAQNKPAWRDRTWATNT